MHGKAQSAVKWYNIENQQNVSVSLDIMIRVCILISLKRTVDNLKYKIR